MEHRQLAERLQGTRQDEKAYRQAEASRPDEWPELLWSNLLSSFLAAILVSDIVQLFSKRNGTPRVNLPLLQNRPGISTLPLVISGVIFGWKKNQSLDDAIDRVRL